MLIVSVRKMKRSTTVVNKIFVPIRHTQRKREIVNCESDIKFKNEYVSLKGVDTRIVKLYHFRVHSLPIQTSQQLSCSVLQFLNANSETVFKQCLSHLPTAVVSRLPTCSDTLILVENSVI